jgi:Domain of unknown function (DUF1814).
MLQKEAMVSEIIALIKELQSASLFKEHFLVGGTALTLQLGHRTSTDIDLFTLKEQNAIEIIQYLKMLRHDIEPKDVPLFIKQKIEEYNKDILIVN